MDEILLKIPKKSEYMSTIRLTSSALSNLKGFNIDEIEDIKVIISEICTFFIKNLSLSTEELEISYQVFPNKIIVTVADLNAGEISEDSLNDDMSVMIIESLSDNFNYDLNNKTITFEKTKIGVD
ncbi:MAG TPA: hypothetical protein DC024_04855 [Clostridiales bacterium]|jgi:serine/threonine-protein kinase RsbW|nr:hypothetical protein [Tissierellia bacterium]MDD4438722.1 hypothetical protein [Tissierellia bacterium]HBC30561.1 hypothetical protein [Clostridiales bacterium]HCS10087.1 hypothetical protein [Clostridiales bacterium]